MGAEYRFVDRWSVQAPLTDVYEVVGNTLGYPTWWGDVFVSVEGDEGPPRPGRQATIVSRGFLPYRLRWQAQIVEANAPHGFSFTMTGDFVGGGSWTFVESVAGVDATFDFRPRVEKAGVKQLTPVLRPVFRWNHSWAMKRGERGLRKLFEERRGNAS
jgi:Polyketide cyclase / dehydrase and lipid transport.